MDLVKKKEVRIENMERLKCELKRFGINNITDFNKDLITKEEYECIKKLKNDSSIVIRKADKSNMFVILNKEDYMNKINIILND